MEELHKRNKLTVESLRTRLSALLDPTKTKDVLNDKHRREAVKKGRKQIPLRQRSESEGGDHEAYIRAQDILCDEDETSLSIGGKLTHGASEALATAPPPSIPVSVQSNWVGDPASVLHGNEASDGTLSLTPVPASRRSIAECFQDEPWKVPFRVGVSLIGATVDDPSVPAVRPTALDEELETMMPVRKRPLSRTVMHLIVHWSLPLDSLIGLADRNAAQSSYDAEDERERSGCSQAFGPSISHDTSQIEEQPEPQSMSSGAIEGKKLLQSNGNNGKGHGFYFHRSSYRLIRRLDEVAQLATTLRQEYPQIACRVPSLSLAAAKRTVVKSNSKGPRISMRRFNEVNSQILLPFMSSFYVICVVLTDPARYFRRLWNSLVKLNDS